MLIKSLCPSRRKLFGFVVAIFLTLALHPSVSLAAREQTFGVVALTNVASIGILDGDTQTVTAPLLTGELGGASAGDVLDVVISPNGKTTLVSNFSASTVFFIDTSDPDAPEVIGSLVLSFSPEDMDMTPDGNYVLVSDGGLSTKIAVLNVKSRTLVEEFNDPTLANQAVAVTPDGETVLTADTNGGAINAFTLNDSGHLTYVASTDVSNSDTLFPVNIAISPDGETAIVASVAGDADDMAFPVLSITGPGQITLSEMVTPSADLLGAQTVVFNHEGTKAYLNCEQESDTTNVVVVLNVSSSGEVTDSGTSIETDFENASQLYGVETMALDNAGENLYVSNFDPTAGETHIQIVDVDTNTISKTISFDPISGTDSIPTGIAFWMYDIEGQFEDGDSGSDYNLKLNSISGISVRDADSEIDPHTKNSDKEIKVIVTGRNRPTVSFGLIDEDDKDVEVNKYDIQIQYTDVLGRRLDSYKTWVKGIDHKTPDKPEIKYKDGFRIKYTGSTKDRVEVKPINKELKEGTYYVRVKAYDNADNTVNSKEAKLLIGTGSTGDLTITTLGAITYDSKYKYYYYNSNLLTIKGTANPSKQVDLYQNGAKLTQVTAGSDGKYTINYTLENGIYNLKLVQDQDSIPFTLNVDNTSKSFPANLLTEN